MIMGFAFLPNTEPVLWLRVRWNNNLKLYHSDSLHTTYLYGAELLQNLKAS